METKICKQCGELKPIEQFRRYYGGRTGTYRTCKLCEKINARYKYLRGKATASILSGTEQVEHDKIEALYEAQRQAGLQPPRKEAERNKPLVDSLDDMINKYNSTKSADASADKPAAPAELQQWLTIELKEEPDYYLDEVYEELKSKYRPTLSINQDTMQPVYDDTYKDTLDKILERFYEYEDAYYDKE